MAHNGKPLTWTQSAQRMDLSLSYFKANYTAYAFKTLSLGSNMDYFNRKYRVVITNPGMTYSFDRVPVYAVSSEYLQATIHEHLSIEASTEPKMDPFQYLYTRKGMGTAVIGSFMAKMLKVGIGD
jgi:hypothetical protein